VPIGIIILSATIYLVIANKLNDQSKHYTKLAVTRITKTWDILLYDKLIDDSVKPSIRWDKIDADFSNYKNKLGYLTTFEGAQGKARITFEDKKLRVYANYAAKVTCEKAMAHIRIKIIKIDRAWKILEFNIFSEALKQ